jgi:hypothetical protein
MAIVDPKSGVYKSARKAVLVRVHILGPASIAIDSRSLSVFLPYGDVERDTLQCLYIVSFCQF